MTAEIELIRKLYQKNQNKIVLIVMDGLGGLPLTADGRTELETAETPNMNLLTKEGSLGQIVPVRHGITPGSGPAHLALFGIDPLEYEFGRGVLEATGIGFDLKPGDVAARANFCTLDTEGNIVDRRAGVLPDQEAKPIIERLQSIEIPEIKVDVQHVKEYRFVVIFRGLGIDPNITDTDPQMTGVAPLAAKARSTESEHAAELINQWLIEARKKLTDEPKANFLNLRGFSTLPKLPQFEDTYGLHAVCIAVYTMYRGLSRLVGMEIQTFNGESPTDEFAAAAEVWEKYDFFFIHIKQTDSRAELGDFNGKVKLIEEVDSALPILLKLNPAVIVITGDHTTPARMMSHSWHPVPFLLWAPKTVRPDNQTKFGEMYCRQGGLGTFLAKDSMLLMMAHAKRLQKYGA